MQTSRCNCHGILLTLLFHHPDAFADVDYVAVSLRKWMGVISGGLAFQCGGTFQVTPLPADEHHLSVRDYALSTRHEYEHTNNEELNKSRDTFWKAKLGTSQNL